MFTTCFEPEGSSSGRLSYVYVWYNLFTCQRCKQACRWKTAYTFVMSTNYTIQPSYWRWTLGFKICSKHRTEL